MGGLYQKNKNGGRKMKRRILVIAVVVLALGFLLGVMEKGIAWANDAIPQKPGKVIQIPRNKPISKLLIPQ